ncbi:hypothetical protein RF11_08647 [Thelohanellus kitauei]|uniref:Uncharacterized protein n=1 Tax=Thelohanellus kitauei TaxID=669202 RepID=A0A0C2NE04_THEKT|nr:hypothetical protein RF11_08647 [Thelohanellus kitauei]
MGKVYNVEIHVKIEVTFEGHLRSFTLNEQPDKIYMELYEQSNAAAVIEILFRISGNYYTFPKLVVKWRNIDEATDRILFIRLDLIFEKEINYSFILIDEWIHPSKEIHQLSSDRYPDSNIKIEFYNLDIVPVKRSDIMYTDKGLPAVTELSDSVEIRQYDEETENKGFNFFDAFRTNGFQDATNFDDYYFTRSTDGPGDVEKMSHLINYREHPRQNK